MSVSRIFLAIAISLSFLFGTIGAASAQAEERHVVSDVHAKGPVADDCCVAHKSSHHAKCQGDLLALITLSSDPHDGGFQLHEASNTSFGKSAFQTGLLDPPRV